MKDGHVKDEHVKEEHVKDAAHEGSVEVLICPSSSSSAGTHAKHTRSAPNACL